MFLSAMRVNVGYDKPGRQWLRNIYRVHQRLWMGFAPLERREGDPFFLDVWDGPQAPEGDCTRTNRGFLFRVEVDGPARILVQSVQKPDWSWAFQNAPGFLLEQPRVKKFEPEFQQGQELRFRLRANPTKRLSKQRRRVPVGTDEKTLWQWLCDKGRSGGFQLPDAPDGAIRDVARHEASKNGSKNPIRYMSVLYEGRLSVTDAQEFTQTIAKGIGPAKAFGCGLLSVAPA